MLVLENLRITGRKDIHSAIIPGGSISPSSGAICPVSLPSPCFPSSLPLPLLDGPHIIPAPSHCKASSARVQAGKAAPTVMILWRLKRAPSPFPSPAAAILSDPRTRTILKWYTFAWLWRKKKKRKKETPSSGFKLKMEWLPNANSFSNRPQLKICLKWF